MARCVNIRTERKTKNLF